MAEINRQEKKMVVKIVYYGPALSGKTTNLMHLHEILEPGHCSEFMTFETKKDRTLFLIFFRLKDFANPGEQDPEYIDLDQCLDSTLNVVGNKLKNKIIVTKDYGALPQVCCYPRKISQIFMNILINAAQAIVIIYEVIKSKR